MDKHYRIRFEDPRLNRAWFTADKCRDYNHAKEIRDAYEAELVNYAREIHKDVGTMPVVLVVVQHDDEETFSYVD